MSNAQQISAIYARQSAENDVRASLGESSGTAIYFAVLKIYPGMSTRIN